MVISGRLQLRRALLTFALDKNKDCVSMSNVSPPSLHHECAGKGWELVFCTRSDMQLTQQQHLHKKVFGKIATLRIKFHKCETLRIKLHKYACFLIWKLQSKKEKCYLLSYFRREQMVNKYTNFRLNLYWKFYDKLFANVTERWATFQYKRVWKNKEYITSKDIYSTLWYWP